MGRTNRATGDVVMLDSAAHSKLLDNKPQSAVAAVMSLIVSKAPFHWAAQLHTQCLTGIEKGSKNTRKWRVMDGAGCCPRLRGLCSY